MGRLGLHPLSRADVCGGPRNHRTANTFMCRIEVTTVSAPMQSMRRQVCSRRWYGNRRKAGSPGSSRSIRAAGFSTLRTRRRTRLFKSKSTRKLENSSQRRNPSRREVRSASSLEVIPRQVRAPHLIRVARIEGVSAFAQPARERPALIRFRRRDDVKVEPLIGVCFRHE